MNWDKCTAVERHPTKVSGAWVFRGTRVPVYALLDYWRCAFGVAANTLPQ